MVIERIVRETSLSEGDVKNALVSLSNIVCDALKLGMSVDLAELGSFRLTVPSKMMDSPEEVTVADALKTPKITFTRCRQCGGIEHRPGQREGFYGWRHCHRAEQ